jgi:acyl-CoA thioesterase-1
MLHFGVFRLPAVLLAVCALAAACNKAAEEPARAGAPIPSLPADAPDPAKPKVVFLGDSLTAGYGLDQRHSYPALLQQRMEAEGYAFTVVNAGVSGDTTAGGLRRADWALDGNVRVLVVALGANDGLRGLPVGEMKQNLTAIIRRARGKNAAVILAGMEAPPNYGQEYASAFRNVFRDVAKNERVAFIPFLLDKVAGQSSLNLGDGIHPNEQGTRIVADTVWTALRPILDEVTAGS